MSTYKPIEIHHTSINGFTESMEGMRLPKKSKSDSYRIGNSFGLGQEDAKLAGNLIRAGSDHAKAMRGIIVWVTIKMQVGFMIHLDTYRIGREVLSTTSAMHGELKGLSGLEMVEQKQNDLQDKQYTQKFHISYQCLRSIYRARKAHSHQDWRIFCQWVETLSYFDRLIFPEFKQEKAVKLLF